MHEIQVVEGLPDEHLPAIAAIDGGASEAHLREQLEGRKRILACIATVDGKLAGYKVGYEDRPRYFESWIGAVAPEFRRRGIARELMERQHRWCRDHGYLIIHTITEGSNRAMLAANLEAGFEIVGTFLDRRKILKVLLQKHLQEP